MRRTTNLNGLKRILQRNTNADDFVECGYAKGQFFIYLTNGQRYLVKEGYNLFWWDKDILKIEETSIKVKKNAQRRASESKGGFLEGLLVIAENLRDNKLDSDLSNKVEIEWTEISDIEDIS